MTAESTPGLASHETAVASLVDDSAPGSAFVIGGARGNGTGAALGPWLGKVNRLYVYHAPGGTFTAADFAAIRAFVKDVTPLP